MKERKWNVNDFNKEELLRNFDMQDVCVSYSGDYQRDTVNHIHNSCEILVVEQGGAIYEINNEIYKVKKNSVLIIGETDRHKVTFTDLPYIRYGLNILPSFLQSLSHVHNYLNVFRTHSEEEIENLTNIENETFDKLLRIMWELKEETESDSADKGDYIYALVLEMAIILKRLLRLETRKMNGIYKSMDTLKNYIDQHYWENLSLEELSRLFYLQPNTISKNFHKVWNRTLNSYINSVRIANAVRILETTEFNITEISEMVGYASLNTFLRQFKNKMDCSPFQYRKNLKRKVSD